MQKTINLSSYIFFLLSNFLLIIYIPEEIINEFLSIYSFFSIIFGAIFVILFSNYYNKSKNVSLIIFFITLLVIFYNNWSSIILFYTLLILYFDYSTSQILNSKYNFFAKILIFIITIPFVLNLISFKEVIYLRIFFILLILIIIFFSNNKPRKLELNYSFIYVILSHLSYFLPLFLLTYFYKNLDLKIIYIFTQIMLSIPLKKFDYEIRFKNKIIKNNNIFLFLLVFVSIPMFLKFQFPFIIIYLAGIISIQLTIKLCQKK